MPPSSTPGDGEILHHGLHHVVHHNSITSYPQEQGYDEGVHLQSRYSSPGQEDAYYHGQKPRYAYHQHQDSGLGIQYVSFTHLLPIELTDMN